jgi:hypothetical protein
MNKLSLALIAFISASAAVYAGISLELQNNAHEAVRVQILCDSQGSESVLTSATIPQGGSQDFSGLLCKPGYKIRAGNAELSIKGIDPRKSIEVRKKIIITGYGDELKLEEQ